MSLRPVPNLVSKIMSPEDLFTVAVRVMAVWLITVGTSYLLMMVTGPFATLIVGIALLIYARIRAKAGTAAWRN
jgi:hypothetical protein